jgi:hypothetical protein
MCSKSTGWYCAKPCPQFFVLSDSRQFLFLCLGPGVPDGIFFIPSIPIWVKKWGGLWMEKVGILYDHLKYV